MKDSKLKVQIGTKQAPESISIEVIPNGPYAVNGISEITQQFIMLNEENQSGFYQEGDKYLLTPNNHLCRCGLSKNKPFCDGSHKKAGQQGVDLKETATSKSGLKTAELIEGPEIYLTDDVKLCAYARFCDNGDRIWNEVESADEFSKERTLFMAHHCPAGRLIVWDNETQRPIEPDEEPEVGLMEDYPRKCSGPIMLTGGIPLKSANGEYYEVRNRQTLCRCGQSCNKPFCDGTHASMKFKDDLQEEPTPDGKIS